VWAGYFPSGAVATLAKRTGAKVVLLCQSVREQPTCPDYIGMLDYNVRQLADAFRE
jgi:ABC-type Zn uptake system ZnuABC Zn-binding protein ZnuA